MTEPPPRPGRLVVCPTPIGNLEDVTLRVLAALREADVLACEDTRTTKVLLDRYGVVAERVRYDEHVERRAAPRLVERMRAGETVALVSDAGMPLVSDPGFVLVQAAVAAGLAVEVLPGPSAALTALVASGLPAATWRFAGFLPAASGRASRDVRRRGDARRVRVAAARRRDARRAGRARPRAPGRRLPRADEAARGDRPRHAPPSSRSATPPSRRAARSCSSIGRRRGGRRGRARPARRRSAGSSRPAPGPRVAASVVAELTGASANALYAAALGEA